MVFNAGAAQIRGWQVDIPHNGLQVAVIDYEMGNLFSVKRACEQAGLYAVITADKSIIMNSDGVILPGVGAFGDAMESLEKKDIISPIKDFVKEDKPLMAICLGMQLLMSESEEFGHHKGLNIIEGSVVRFPVKNKESEEIKVPHVGWNKICQPSSEDRTYWNESPLKNIMSGEFMYFVHSYYAVPSDKRAVLSTTTYEGTQFCSGIRRRNVFACQYHPEKSAAEGIKIYKDWASIIRSKQGHVS